jgi:hypothetical protein
LTVTNADLSPNEYRPPRRVALLAALVIASMSVIGLWRGIAEELRVGRQAAYLETFTRTHPATPLPAVTTTLDAESIAAGHQTVAAPAEPKAAPEAVKAEKAEKAEATRAVTPTAERAAPPDAEPAPPPARAQPADEPEPSAVDRILEEERRRDDEAPPPDEPTFDPYAG